MAKKIYTITSTETQIKKDKHKNISLELITIKGIITIDKKPERFELTHNYQDLESTLKIYGDNAEVKRTFQIKVYNKKDFDIFEVLSDHTEKFFVKENRLDDEIDTLSDEYKAYYTPNKYNEAIKDFIEEVC